MKSSSYVSLSDSSPEKQTPSTVTPLFKKPLPSPPVATVVASSPPVEARSLLDATEKPLRRSPPGMPHQREDWPVLTPGNHGSGISPPKAIDSGVLSASPLSSSASALQIERYPKLGPSTQPQLSVNCNATSEKPIPYAIRRKEVPVKGSRADDELVSGTAEGGDPSISLKVNENHENHKIVAVDFAYAQPNTVDAPVDLSVSLALTEKSTAETKSTIQPRQTRTSSLRARLSAGNANSSMNPKANGSDDPTVADKPSNNINDQLPSTISQMATRSPNPGASRLQLTNRSKDDSLRVGRAPAQFIAGSRRPVVQRKSSRHGLKGEPHGLENWLVSQPPKRAAPAAPATGDVTEHIESSESGSAAAPDLEAPRISRIKALQAAYGEVPKASESRKSSIPIFRHAASHGAAQTSGAKVVSDDISRVGFQPKKYGRNGFEIFEDQNEVSPNEGLTERGATDSTRHEEGVLTADPVQQLSNLEAIEESPKQEYHLKRLSAGSASLGPVLKISKSAERVIMGSDSGSDKENRSSAKARMGIRSRSAVRLSSTRRFSLSASSSFPYPQKGTGRPISSTGLPSSVSSFGNLGAESREKKVKSADLGYSPATDHLLRRSAKFKPISQVSRKDTDTLSDDPFFDACSTHDRASNESKSPAKATTNQAEHNEEGALSDENPWITPLPASKRMSSFSENFSSFPHHDEKQLGKMSGSLSATESGRGLEMVQQESRTSPAHCGGSGGSQPITPSQTPPKIVEIRTSPFPPRNSSRMTPPDYTIARGVRGSSSSPSDASKAYSRDGVVVRSLRDDKAEPSQHGLAASRLNLGQGPRKRESLARDSTKSQDSTSKGVLSNLRGLFHKRASDGESFSSRRSNKKGKQKVSITASGSPFPDMSEVHPAHRATLASSHRATGGVHGRSLTLSGSDGSTKKKVPVTPSVASPLPSEISTSTTLAMQLLESARTEGSSPMKERCLELGRILVEAITQAREAEKAMEEARQAARRAEVAHLFCKRSVGDAAARVKDWTLGLGKDLV